VPAPLLVALILLAALLVTGGGHASAVGRRHGIRFLEGYVAHPERFANEVMRHFDALGGRKLHQLAVFLADSKGRR